MGERMWKSGEKIGHGPNSSPSRRCHSFSSSAILQQPVARLEVFVPAEWPYSYAAVGLDTRVSTCNGPMYVKHMSIFL